MAGLKIPPTVVRAEPIAVRREAAAAMMGISVSLFEAQVRKGKYPKARQLSDGCSGWLVSELQACAHALPISELPPGPGRRAPQAEQPAG